MRTLSILSAILISATLAATQTQPSKPLPRSPLSPFEQELAANQDQFMRAMAEKNVAYVSQAVATDFQGIGTNGDFFDKDELVSDAREGSAGNRRVYDLRVLRLNDDSAVVTYNLIIPGGHFRYRHMSDTWAREGGKWKLKFQQVTMNLWSATDFD